MIVVSKTIALPLGYTPFSLQKLYSVQYGKEKRKWKDLNLRPSVPKTATLPLRHTSKNGYFVSNLYKHNKEGRNRTYVFGFGDQYSTTELLLFPLLSYKNSGVFFVNKTNS